MKPAVINVDLAWGAACDLVLLVQDAAGVPLDLSGASLDFYLKAGDASVPLAVDAADAAEGLVRVRVPGQDLGMCPWEGWLQTSPETPRERILRGLMTVTDKVDPRAEGNPSTHRYFVRLSDAVTVSVDSVDLAWWAYAHALKAQKSMESLADSWPKTVSDGEQQIIEARNEAVTAVQDKQAAFVLAVGRASQTAQQNIASAQADAVAAVQETEEEAQGTITPLVQRAETAKDDIDQAERRINTAATNAATSATSAANSATAAQQALAAMPQVDESGNMTLAGGLTAAGAINANGGVQKPLTVLPTTAQSVVNRADAFGAHCVQLAHSGPALIKDITSDGLTAKTEVPGQLYSFNAASKTIPKSGTIKTTDILLMQSNYCRVRGFTIPLTPRIYDAGCCAKLSFNLGQRANITEKIDDDLDVFRISPKAGITWNQFTENMQRFIDVTFYYDDVEDSNDKYKIRVRELRYINSSAKWVVKETITRVSSFNTHIRNVHNLTFHMANNVASLWAVVNGYWGVVTIWLADLTPPSDLFDSNLLSTTLCVDMLRSTFFIGNPILFIPPGRNQQNGAYNAFKAVETRNLISETTYDFTPYELEES